jgi:hypothetical protein
MGIESIKKIRVKLLEELEPCKCNPPYTHCANELTIIHSKAGGNWRMLSINSVVKLLSFRMLDSSIVSKYKRTQHPIREHTYSKHKCITKVSPHLAGRRIHIQTSLQNKSVRSTQEFTGKDKNGRFCLFMYI